MVVDDVRNVVAEHHFEALVADVPRHGFLADGRQHRFEVVQLQQRRFVRDVPRGDDRRGRAVGEQRGAHDGVRIVRGPDVQGAELGADHQHHSLRIGLAEGLRGPQRRECRVAAHKAEVVPLNGRVQPQGADDLVVRARVEEPGAGDRHEMSYVK